MDDSSKSGLGPRFSLRTLLEITAVVALVLFLIYGEVRQAAIGRYQLIRGPVSAGSSSDATFLLDTETGECWINDGTPWQKVGPR